MIRKSSRLILSILYSLVIFGCGGSSEESGMLIQGTLVQGGEAAEHALAVSRHGAGEQIENVKVCALGECSTTDNEGQWGFVASNDFHGGELLISVNGHGIDASLVVDIPEGASDVKVSLEHHEDGSVHAHSVIADGIEQEEDEEHEEGEHTHDEHD